MARTDRPQPPDRPSRVPRLSLLCLAVLLLAAPLARAGEGPPGWCYTSGYSDDSESARCTLISSLEVFGGTACKPIVIATALAVHPGVYFCRLRAGRTESGKSMVLRVVRVR